MISFFGLSPLHKSHLRKIKALKTHSVSQGKGEAEGEGEREGGKRRETKREGGGEREDERRHGGISLGIRIKF